MSQETPTVHRGTHRLSIDAEAIADDLIANAAVDTPAERGATEPQVLVDEVMNDSISCHQINAWEWFEGRRG